MTRIDDARRALLAVWEPLLKTPFCSYPSRKIIHDSIWGTTRYEPWEAALLDLGIFQRLRGLKQTGFAYFTYPAAEHSRFQHTLGVAHAASKIFDSLVSRPEEGGVSKRGRDLGIHKTDAFTKKRERFRILLRLAALVHDTGHSFYSHTSERIFSLVSPFPELIADLTTSGGKRPGAAEIVVYLLVTSAEWKKRVSEIWKATRAPGLPPDDDEWETMGRWVMGQERRPEQQFLADIVSGPLDADKLDYISRDAYSAGIPIGYDLERFTATVCVDPQGDRYRLTIPVKGINALEQLVLGRLVLNSYLYHHQKVRAAEVFFERTLVREYLAKGTVLSITPPWPLFAMQDADVYGLSKQTPGLETYKAILLRTLPIRVAEFKSSLLPNVDSEAVSSEYTGLLSAEATQDMRTYGKLIGVEDELADASNRPRGTIFVDVPKSPSYKELEDLQLPDDATGEAVAPTDLLNYGSWVAAYIAHRSFVRVFASREAAAGEDVWKGISSWFADHHLALPESARRHRSA